MAYFVKVDTVPSGAKLYLEGKYKGLTPVLLENLEGELRTKITKTGYKDYTDLLLKPGMHNTLQHRALIPVEEPPPAPPPPEEPRKIIGKVTAAPLALPLIFAKITFGTKSTASLGDGTYEILDPEFISGPITCSLPGYETASKMITSPETGSLTVNFTLSPVAVPPVKPPPVVPEKTWWEKLLEFIVSPVFKPFLVDKLLFQQGYKLLTGKEMTDAEYELKKLQLADWVLHIDLLLRLFTGRNLKGEAEEFGKAGDWFNIALTAAVIAIPGPADDVAAQFAAKTISKTEAARLTTKMGEKAAVNSLTKIVKAHPETAAKFLAKFPKPVREAVISGLYKTPWGRIAIVTLSKTGYFKYLRPWWKSTLIKAGAASGIAILLMGAIGSYPFAGFIKEESLQTLGWATETAKKFKDIKGLGKALDLTAEILDKTLWEGFLAAIPYANILAQLRDYYEAARTKMEIDEAGFEGLKKEWEEEAAPKGTLIVSPTPTDAKVSVDKLPYINSAFEQIAELGTYHVLVSKWEYVSQDKYLEVKEDEITTWSPTLEKEVAPPPLKAKLIISVTPEDAKIEVADHPEITKPGDYNVSPGSYTITFSKEGYQNLRRTVYLDEGKTEIVAVILLTIPPEIPPELVLGTLIISVTPEDSLIEVAGQEEITAPGTYELAPGSYAVRVSKEGFVTDIKTAIVSEKKDTAISFILEAVEPVPPVIEKAVITITSSPSDSDIYIDGVYKWTTTPYTILLDEGSYWVRVQRDGYYPVEVEVEVEAGEVAELPFVLEAIPEPDIPPYDYIPQTPYYPTYVPDVPYIPTAVTTPTVEVPPYSYDLLYTPAFDIPGIEPISLPTERELLINIETTDVKPWKGRIYSIAVLDLTDPAAEILIKVDNNEENLIKEFLDLFESLNPAKLVGFKLIFDYRYIFSKMMLYRITNKKFYNVVLRDVKQILDQVKEEFVYYPDKTGTLNDWGKLLLGRGKLGSQELMLRKYIQGDFDYVNSFQLRQIELTRDLYNLARFTMGEAFISSPSPITSPISTPETPVLPETPGIQVNKQCPVCFAYLDKTTGKCPICGPAI